MIERLKLMTFGVRADIISFHVFFRSHSVVRLVLNEAKILSTETYRFFNI